MRDEVPLLFRELRGPSREPAWQLLSTNSGNMETLWSEGIRVFLLGDPADAPTTTAPAVLTVLVHPEPVVELLSLAVSRGWDERAVAQRLIASLADRCRSEGRCHLVARPAAGRFAALLRTCGFRPGPPELTKAERFQSGLSNFLLLDLSSERVGASPDQLDGSPIPRA